MAHKFPKDLLNLVNHLKKLPGIGTRTAERFAFELLSWPQEKLVEFGACLQEIQEKIPHCSTCGCFAEKEKCLFCDSRRDSTSLCILASPRDVYAIEDTHAFRGIYHIVEHLLSPLDIKQIESLWIEKITERIEKNGVKEVIIALDSTLEGDTTALYLKKQLETPSLSISRLAFGLPVGSSLEHIDGGTLTRAFVGRQLF